jgi:thiamine transporter
MNLFNLLTLVGDSTIDAVKLITIIALALLVIVFIVISASKKSYNTRSVVYAAICISLAFALSFIKFSMPYGGSVTLASFVPLLIYSYFYGPVKGMFAGIVYGLLQFIQDSWFLTPVQFILDYILAFSGIAFAGAFKNIIKNKTAGVVAGATAAGLFRCVMHIFAGILFFNAGYVEEGLPQTNAFIYSSLYNLSYVIPDVLIAVGVLIYTVKSGYFDKIAQKIK